MRGSSYRTRQIPPEERGVRSVALAQSGVTPRHPATGIPETRVPDFPEDVCQDLWNPHHLLRRPQLALFVPSDFFSKSRLTHGAATS